MKSRTNVAYEWRLCGLGEIVLIYLKLNCS